MAVKTKLTPAKTYVSCTTDGELWIVDNKIDADALNEAMCGTITVELDNGNPISEWTEMKGIGDWDEAKLQIDYNKIKVVHVALTPFVAASDKTKKFVKALTGGLSALGFYVDIHAIPNGTTIAEIVKGASKPEYVKERLAKAIDAATAKQTQGVTIGDGAKDFMYEIAVADFIFHKSEKGEQFLTSRKENGHIAIPFSELSHYLVREYKNRFKTTATPKDVKAAIMTVEADCAAAPKSRLGLRTVTSPSTGRQWIDLGREDGQVVLLTEGGWSVHAQPDADVFFRRSSVIHELPVPNACPATETFARLEGARRFANVTDAQWPLVVGWMATHMINDSDHLTPLIFFLGGSQSGKTTISSLTKFLVEGDIEKGTDAGSRDGDLELAMSNARLYTMNNISSVPLELSDLLCKVYEGLSIKTRKMHSHDELTLDINCSVIANGVTVGRMKEDLKTRVLALDINPKHGGTPWRGGAVEQAKTIDDEMRRVHADALGAILTLAALAMQHHDTYFESVKDDIFRLKGYATCLRTLDMIWSLEGRTVNEYKRLMDVMSEEALEDPLFEGIRRLAVQDSNWDGEKTAWVYEVDLMTLKNRINENGWKAVMDTISGGKSSNFSNTKSLSEAITRKETDWKRMGVTYENIGRKRVAGSDNKQTFYRFTFAYAEETAWSQTPAIMV